MNIYVITTPYMYNNFFGTYSTLKRARLVLEDFLANDENITAFEDVGNYYYTFTTKTGEQFSAEILWDLVDAEFEEGIVKEDD